jgi:hypothetical protein
MYKEEFFIYHSAPVETIPKILEEGLTPGAETYRREMEEDLAATANRKNISLPVTRQECVFCYPSLHQAIEMATFGTGPPGSEQPLFPRSGLLVIDARSIRDELFVADFDFFSDVIDLQVMDEPDHAVRSESYEAALMNYAESVTPLHTFDSVAEINAAFRTPEVLTEAAISPAEIRETVLRKEILGTGWFSSYPALPTGE